MNPEPKSSPSSNHPKSDRIEPVHLEFQLVEFIGDQQVYGFHQNDLRRFSHYVLTKKRRQRPHLPPQTLDLYCPAALIVFSGWRLGLLLESLMFGSITRVDVVDAMLAKLVIDEPLVCRIYIRPAGWEKHILLNPPKTQP